MNGQVDVANYPTRSLTARPVARTKYRLGPHRIVLPLLAAIVVLDQGVKWWAWRHASGVRVNYGGDVLSPATLGTWYRLPVSGALLDWLDSGLLIVAGWLFLRRRRSIPMLISGAAVIGGWGSNILDRLFMHYWTAPGSVRGVVDFIPIGPHYYNVADMFIIVGTPLFILAGAVSIRQTLVTRRPPATKQVARRTHHPHRARAVMLAVATPVILATIVGVGAANFGGVNAPIRLVSSSTDQPVLITHQGNFAALD
ncbi:MAG: signal peptidase [Pseudonocardiales bacterium]|jgi:lipoprotein signal peptidase|nr:signal peptidase [Pseudonocardiales bacterium]